MAVVCVQGIGVVATTRKDSKPNTIRDLRSKETAPDSNALYKSEVAR